ncbi:MAG: 4-(cytidine 5'-diphospho)-2-C-methyl-D-erythritol kinase [Lachnospiraceae bacterium]|nr:4-(cytidine 5'-diphospho)-2-C-methyl-D-erythritol kinase [Lachnospiraceae bacterium]
MVDKDTFTLKAYAKVNLGLDVLRRLPSGYHEVKMIMQTVGIFDTLTFTRLPEGIRLTVEGDGLPGENVSVGAVPADENNLIWRAARQMMEKYQVSGGIHIHLHKNIPVAAGMAGGSTDAAAAYRGVNRMFSLGASEEEMRKMAVATGADVPYCIMGGTVLAEGIGEKLTALPDAPACHVLVAKPDISVSTKYVYENLHVESLACHPDVDGMAEAVGQGDLRGMLRRMGNVLETVTAGKYPVIGQLKEYMEEHGACRALMSGSGPTVFGLFDDKTAAENCCSRLRSANMAKQIFLTGFVNPAKEEA